MRRRRIRQRAWGPFRFYDAPGRCQGSNLRIWDKSPTIGPEGIGKVAPAHVVTHVDEVERPLAMGPGRAAAGDEVGVAG